MCDKKFNNENIKEEFDTKDSPCVTEINGKTVKTCELFGHYYENNVCFRCGHKEEIPIYNTT